MIKQLQLLGMTRNEALAYWALVKKGSCRAGPLINNLGMHRNIVYSALESLIHKGYVTKVSIRGVWQFQITDPGVLLTNLKRHEEIARNIIEEISSFSDNAVRQIKVHEGAESYQRYWTTSLERVPEGTIDYVAGGDIENWSRFLGKALDNYWGICHKRKICWKTLYFGITELEKSFLKALPLPFEARNWKGNIPRKFPGNFNIIHDTVILHTMLEPPRLIEIRDNAILPIFQNYFDMMWDQAELIISST